MKIITCIIAYFSFVTASAGLAGIVTGTPEREEQEYKSAFIIKGTVRPKPLVGQLRAKLESLQQQRGFAFPALLGQTYDLDTGFSAFMFRDIYLDTHGLDVLQARASYRLRYRWNRLAHYARHRIFPFLKPFWPTRCEIQFKRDYAVDPGSGRLRVKESRFEFRNESEPFIFAENAPPPPWPEPEYLEHARQGEFRDFQMLPTTLLRQTLESPADNLQPRVYVNTVRYRTHINIGYNPWGWGPNPEQIFIVTLDLSDWRYADGSQAGHRLLELEIEADRNVSTMLTLAAEVRSEDPLIRYAGQASVRALSALRQDHRSLQEELSTIIAGYLQATPLPVTWKYARIMESRIL